MDKDLEIFCVTDKHLNFFNDVKYKLAAVGKNNFPSNYITCNTGENIFYKEEYYSELTFHYWFWKNILPTIKDNHWVGFCAYRQYWSNKKKITENASVEDVVIKEIPSEWEKFDTVIGEHFYVNNLKFSKLMKAYEKDKGWQYGEHDARTWR